MGTADASGPRTDHAASARVSVAPLAWATWRLALGVLGAFLAARIAYSVWLSPWELVGDEAYYWVQSRHLDLGYNEKGPLLAWLIAASCRAFGDVEWAVRLPMVLACGAAAWGVGRLAMAISRGDERVGFLAVVCFLLLPCSEANAQICTQDGPLTALLVALTAVGLRIFRRWRAALSTWREWLLFWALMGVGVVLKQSIFVFLPSLALYWLLFRRDLPLRPVFFAQQAAGIAVMGAVSAPMIVWNARHGWPMVAHTLGHLGAGGDQAGAMHRGNPALWELNTVGSLIGAVGPGAVALMIWAGVWAWRRRSADEGVWRDQAWVIFAVGFSVVFFCLLSLTKPIVPNWPLPHVAPMCALVAQFGLFEIAAPFERRRTGAASWFRFSWNAMVIYGVAGVALLAFPTALGRLPGLGPLMQRRVVDRLAGSRARFAPLTAVLESARTPGGRAPLIVEQHYHQASLANFYLPGHPDATTTGKYLSRRPSTFDQWPETSLESPSQRGRALILDGVAQAAWDEIFLVDAVRPAELAGCFIATNFQGVRPAYLPAPERPR